MWVWLGAGGAGLGAILLSTTPYILTYEFVPYTILTTGVAGFAFSVLYLPIYLSVCLSVCLFIYLRSRIRRPVKNTLARHAIRRMTTVRKWINYCSMAASNARGNYMATASALCSTQEINGRQRPATIHCGRAAGYRPGDCYYYGNSNLCCYKGNRLPLHFANLASCICAAVRRPLDGLSIFWRQRAAAAPHPCDR